MPGGPLSGHWSPSPAKTPPAHHEPTPHPHHSIHTAPTPHPHAQSKPAPHAKAKPTPHAHAKPTPLATSSEAFIKSHPNRAVKTHEAILRSHNAFTTPWMAGWDEFGAALGAGLDAIGNLRSPSATAPLEQVQTEVTEMLDRAAARRRRRGQPDPWETA